MSCNPDSVPRDAPVARNAVLRELDAFGIPFLCFGDDARVTGLSAAAHALLAELPSADGLVAEIRSMVAAELACLFMVSGSALFPLARELIVPGIVGPVAIRRATLPEPSLRAIAVLPHVSPGVPDDAVSRLTMRERQVACLIASGAPNKQVATRLGISPHTVRHHAEKVFEKLGVRSRTSLACLVSGWERRRGTLGMQSAPARRMTGVVGP